MDHNDLDRLFKPLQMKDLRALARSRGLNPGGGKEELTAAIKMHMAATGNYSVMIAREEDMGMGMGGSPAPANYGSSVQGVQYGSPYGNAIGSNNNNYSRPGGQQNVGNFITDKPSSRVLAPPGGGSSMGNLLGGYGGPAEAPARGYGGSPGMPQQQQGGYTPQQQQPQYGRGRESPPPGVSGMPGMGASPYGYGASPGGMGTNNNNYSRPGGQQNVGNFITDKPSSRVLAPPGGASSIQFGNYTPSHQQSHARPTPLPAAMPEATSYVPSSASYGGPAGFQGGMGGYQQHPGSYGGSSGSGSGGGYDTNAPLGGGAIPIPMGYDANFAPVQQRIPSAGRRAGKPPSGAPGASPGGPNSILYHQGQANNGAPGVGGRPGRGDTNTNNYVRQGGNQNLGNHITDRPSSRVLAPPGGRSQISFG